VKLETAVEHIAGGPVPAKSSLSLSMHIYIYVIYKYMCVPYFNIAMEVISS
jgi:hypothetical protein